MKKLLSLVLSITLLLSLTFPVFAAEIEKEVTYNEPAKLGTVLDLRDETSKIVESDYDVVILSEKQLANASILESVSSPVFIFSDNKDRVSVMKLMGYEADAKIDLVSAVEECTLIGYYIVDGEASPWYVHNNADEKMVLEDVAKLSLKKTSPSTTVSSRGSWSTVDTYTTYITYIQTYLGISGLMQSEVGTTYGGVQYITEFSPRYDQYYDHSIDYFYIEHDYSLNTGGVMSYSPTNTYDTTTISVSYPWSATYTIELGGRMDVTKYSGGVGQDYVKWKFKPEYGAGFNDMYGETVSKFETSTSTKKSSVSVTFYARRTDKRTGTTSVSSYNTGTLLND